MIERLLRPVFTTIQFYAWIVTFYQYPLIGFIILGLYVRPMIRTYTGFLRKYPYCRRQLLAAFLVDYCFPILDLYAWATIDDMGWLTRDLGTVKED
ncbi:putative polysaccharide synthase protein [Phaeoacremonium minimum UCRPA7]|uniref:Putative polysaccharide synthase protein n=1 Tax=Phaeoacremonium minimum (strain UCR-PA7) TaxID=1286976 RepID=R8BNN9_PHAM7|nr:putative polysaccharide synthase protein [Phaeoacremonium minimum UCRPA7]EOO00949.1 putative polysaccharide synthase protein [Phaeoacremonium minimum UCRPA7]